ncbi:MAG: glycosyltransferase family 2 protein [Erysipelotrichaceae bacterium]|nr:glycosyltransferase family 2 protein [Erysipelotrichaceae bacterium]
MKLTVLMSTYNGEKYLAQQLDSLLNQTLKPDRILIRDDGSNDGTIDILEAYSEKNKCISYYRGNNLGAGRSFWELIKTCEEADYYALCDQDDVWMPEKLEKAIAALKQEDEDQALLYCSKFTLTDENLNPIDSKVSSLYNFSDFPHALLYHTAPGCTFVFNHAAREKLLPYDVDQEYFVIHDALIHKVVTMFGRMILDEHSYLYYRQHSNNEIGMTADVFKTFAGRIHRFLHGRIRNYRSETARSLLKVYGDQCSEEKLALLKAVAGYREDPKLKKVLLRDKRFRSHTINDLFYLILVLVNYI